MPHCKGLKQGGKISGKAQVFKGSDQLFVVRGGKCSFKIEMAQDYILLACVRVLHTEDEVSDRSRA